MVSAPRGRAVWLPVVVRVGQSTWSSVSEVAASVGRFGDRYVQRIFTPHELTCCRIRRRPYPSLRWIRWPPGSRPKRPR